MSIGIGKSQDIYISLSKSTTSINSADVKTGAVNIGALWLINRSFNSESIQNLQRFFWLSNVLDLNSVIQ